MTTHCGEIFPKLGVSGEIFIEVVEIEWRGPYCGTSSREVDAYAVPPQAVRLPR